MTYPIPRCDSLLQPEESEVAMVAKRVRVQFLGGPEDGSAYDLDPATMPRIVHVSPCGLSLPGTTTTRVPVHVYWLGYDARGLSCVYRYRGVRLVRPLASRNAPGATGHDSLGE